MGHPDNDDETLVVGSVRVDVPSRVLRLENRDVRLTPTEMRLLSRLAREPGRTVTRKDLLRNARGDGSPSDERTIDVHIRSLRRKLGHNRN
ncbi:MAG: winged helix-turn-helix transcriptional regulator [Planctomycetales bacterium]|nr:winged helix-turn-helix transcriptional regulator [Planctomycetales bacterium]